MVYLELETNMLTLIFLSLLIFLSAYRFKRSLSKVQRRAIKWVAFIIFLFPIFKLCTASTTDKSTEQIYTGIAADIDRRHPGKEKILCVYLTKEHKANLQGFVKTIGAQKVDEIFMKEFGYFVTPQKISEAIKKKGGHYDRLILTFTADELSAPLEIEPAQFEYVVIFTDIKPLGMEDWFDRDKCVIFKINPQPPSENDNVRNAFETSVRIFDHDNYPDWKGQQGVLIETEN